MSEKKRNFNKTSIEVCRNCQGTGFETKPRRQCPVCMGSGRVEKKLNIDITINPYSGA